MQRKLLLMLILQLACYSLLKAQSQYRSPGTGVTVDLGAASNWQVSTDGGATWNGATTAPTGLASGSTILIQAGDTWANAVGTTSIPAGVTLSNNSTLLGTFTAAKLTCAGTLVYSGTAAQTLPSGSAFVSQVISGNLTINNSAGVSTTTSSYLTVNGTLYLQSGQFNCNAGGNSFYFKGTITTGAGILNTGNYIFGATGTGQSIAGTEFVNGQVLKLVAQGTSLSTTGALKVSNALTLTSGTVTLGGPLTIGAATLAATAGSIITQDNMVIMSGTAVQAIPASFFNGNTVNNLTISNATGVTSGGALNIGTSYTVSGLKVGVTPLAVTGTATIGGTLTISSFATTPTSGQVYTILSGTSVSGTFSALVLPAGYNGTLAYSATDVKLTVTPISSTNANLSALTSTAGTLSPSFDSSSMNYTAIVPNATTSVTVTPTAQSAAAVITVNGTTVASGSASPAISLNPGDNTTISITVTAQDGVTVKTYTLVITRIAPLFTFNRGVPANFTVTGSTLSSSTAHIKNGSSLAWNASNGAVLTASSLGVTAAQTGSSTSGSAQFYIYSAAPTNDTLVFNFYTNGNSTPQRVGHMLLNYAGWRDYHRSYRLDYDNGQDAGSGGFTLDKMTITYKPANPSTTATIYLDEFTTVGDVNRREPGPHMQLDLSQFYNGHLQSFVEPLQYFLNAPPMEVPAATAQEQTDAALVQSRYPRSIPTVSSTNLTNAENYVTGCGIFRNADGSINGTRGLTYLYNVDTLVQIGNYVGYLTEAAVNNNDDVAKSNLLLFTEYLLDQGLAEGGRNNVETNDYSHCQKFPVGFLQAVKSGLLTDSLNKGVIRMLKWANGYNIIYNATGNWPSSWLMTDFIYLKATFLAELAGYANVDNQVRDYYDISRFLSLFTNTEQGAEDGIKPDGTGFHHQFNHIHYLYAWGVYADRANSLSGTAFRISQQGFNNMANAIKTIHLEQSPGAALIPNGLCGRYPFGPFSQVSQAQFKEFVNVGGDIEGTAIDTSLAKLYNYIYQTNFYSVPAQSYDGFYHYNYSPLGVKRRGNWMVAMKGLTNTLRGTEIYVNQNMYGRYQSYGSLEVLYTGGNQANGWILNGAGWDWNVYPGTTTVQLPWNSLEPNTTRMDELQSNSFTGALSLGDKHGIFAMDFLENASGHYSPNNLSFKKSVFTFDSIMVCLGTSISSTNASNITSTNLFQAIDTVTNFAPIYVNNTTPISGATYSNTLSTSSGSAWMVTGQTTGYYIPRNGGTVTVARGSQSTPDQSDLNQTKFNTANYSKAYISHGTSPANARYQFVVVPGTTPSAMQSLASTLDGGSVYSVLKQTDSLHSVFYQPDSVTAYAFFKPYNNVNIGYVNSISNKGLVGIKKKGDTLTVTVNNPDLNVVTDASDSIDGWHSAPQNITLVLNGNWNVLSNNSNAIISSASNTLLAGFTLKDGFAGTLILLAAKPPVVALTAPVNNTAVATGSNVTVSATASSANPGGNIVKVDFYRDTTLLGTSTTTPYSFSWNNVANGTYRLTAVATDNFGLTTTSAADTLIVSTPPTVSLTSPANNGIFATGSNIEIDATASSPNTGGSIAKVDFYQGSTLLGTATTSPYSYTWNSVNNGTYVLTAIATDNNGLKDTSAAINIQIEATSFGPVADAYVRNGTYADNNYGTITSMVVKSDAISYFREAYLRFDYSNYTGSSVNSAQFKIYVSGVNTSPSRIVSVYGIADTTWGETTITYNNQPTEGGTFIGNDTISNTSGVWYTLDVTSYINSQLAAGHKKVSFRMINNGAFNGTGDVTFSSREAAANNPQLVFTQQGSMANVIAWGSGTARDISAGSFNAVVYPNPSATTFNLVITGIDRSEGTDIRVIDRYGRILKSINMTTGSTIQFGNDLRSGTYFVEVCQGINRKVLRVIKL